MLNALLMLTLAILGTSFGQYFYKRFFSTKEYRDLVLTIGFFGSVPLFNLIALRELEIDTVYVASSITIGLTTLLAIIFLHEKRSKSDLFAIFCIMGGVVVYNLNV